jgi:hypothetical protein
LDDFGAALTATVEAELEAFGEEIIWRGAVTKAIVGTNKQTKAMVAAGYFENEALNLIVLPPSFYGYDGENPKVNEQITFREKTWRIHEVDQKEFAHAFELTVQLVP